MDLTFQRIDIIKMLEACQDGESQPGVITPRLNGERWLVAQTPVVMQGEIKWSWSHTEAQIHLPLIPYQLSSDLDKALAYMFGLGVRVAMQEIQGHVKRLHIAIGAPALDVPPEERVQPEFGMRYYMGFGLILAK